MSLPDAAPVSNELDRVGQSSPCTLDRPPPVLMTNTTPDAPPEKDDGPPAAPLKAHEDARKLVRLIQCRQCSRPLRVPITLPCGKSLCRECLPKSHEREHITYPQLASRRQGILCPFSECGLEHPATDCNVDVTLSKVMESIAEVVEQHIERHGNVTTSVQEASPWSQPGAPSVAENGPIFQVPGGRLIATYTLAAQGRLGRNTELVYQPNTEESECRALDLSTLEDLLTATQREVDCQVCYSVMLDPVTTFCGHTLCRKCLVRVLDHSQYCPVCRRGLAIPPSLQKQPGNQVLTSLFNHLCPDTMAARAEAVAIEERAGEGDTHVPLFVCTLAFPNQPTFLRIFEPRYRLMLRRCMEGNQQFGMLMYNRYGEPQGELGPVNFYHYGTMLQILQVQVMADGTSVVETRGIYRYRVKSCETQDGYLVGDVERMDDASIVEEERIEAEETSTPPVEMEDLAQQISRMSTQSLLQLGLDFVTRMQNRSAAWLQQRMLDVHGQVPQDPADFPYWFASVLPINDEEKYKLLGTRTVRERLKITATWIRRIELQRWYQSNSCRIL